MENTPGRAHNSGAYIGATLLILIGVVALLGNLIGASYVYESIPLVLGLAFLAAYILTRHYGYLVPAGILSGVGVGVLAATGASSSDAGTYVVLAMGLGFLSVYALDVLVSGSAIRWWPLIPGGLMLVIGTGMSTKGQGFIVHEVQIWAPAALIALGILILVTRAREIRH